MAERIYLIDASAFAYRSFHAIRGLTNSQGEPTNAIYGFARMLVKLFREHQPEYVAVVFDAPGKSFRHETFPEYKANREKMPEDLTAQLPHIHELVEAMNLPLLLIPGYEADDVIGTLARQAAGEGMEAVLVTGDKDFLQLVGEGVKVFDPGKGDEGVWYGVEEVAGRYGTGPDHVIDVMALMGDSSDNVPGVKGVGEKTAKKLIGQYGDVEGVYAHLDEVKGKMKDKLAADREKAFLSRDLVTIKTDVALAVAPRDCKRGAVDAGRLLTLLDRLEFQSLLDDLAPDHREQLPETETDYRLVLTLAELDAAIEEMRAAGRFAVDTETTSMDPMAAELVGVSMSCAPGAGYYVPVKYVEAQEELERKAGAASVPDFTAWEALERLRPLLEDEDVGKIGHNIKYDLTVLARAGVRLVGIRCDTMVASYLTDPSRLRHNLSEVSLHYLKRKTIPISDLIGTGSKTITFDHVPLPQACEYAAEDAEVTWQLAETLIPYLERGGLKPLFDEVEIPLIGVLARMEQAGISLDRDVFAALHDEIETRLSGLEREIHALAGEPFVIGSPKQLQEVLFVKLGLKPIRKTKTGYSTDMEVLEQLAGEHPLPRLVLEYRGLEKLRGTYVEALPKLIHPETGRVHTSFNQAVAATGRLSSSDPNLQNIPVRTEIGRRIRQGFVPAGPDWRLISADYSQIELRLLAHLSGDEQLKQAFRDGADIHRETAARVFGVPADEVTPDRRRQAKGVNFGIVYGISPYGLARNLGVSTAEAAGFIDSYFAQYPGVRAWIEETLKRAAREGYVTTLLGRRRYVAELNSSRGNVRRAAERMAINTPVQGSAADIIKLAMLEVDRALRCERTRMLLQVHDELVLEAPEAEAEEWAESVRGMMENVCELSVPLRADVGIGANWAEIH